MASHHSDESVSPWWARLFWGSVFVGGAYVVTSGFSWQGGDEQPSAPELKGPQVRAPKPLPSRPRKPSPAPEPPIQPQLVPELEQMSMKQLADRITQLETKLSERKQIPIPTEPDSGIEVPVPAASGEVPSVEESARALQTILAKQQADTARGEGDRDREILEEVDRRSAEIAGDLRSQLQKFEIERQKRLDQVIDDAK